MFRARLSQGQVTFLADGSNLFYFTQYDKTASQSSLRKDKRCFPLALSKNEEDFF